MLIYQDARAGVAGDLNPAIQLKLRVGGDSNSAAGVAVDLGLSEFAVAGGNAGNSDSRVAVDRAALHHHRAIGECNKPKVAACVVINLQIGKVALRRVEELDSCNSIVADNGWQVISVRHDQMRGGGAHAQPAIVADVDAIQFNRASERNYAGARAGCNRAVYKKKLGIAGGDAELPAILNRYPAKQYSIRIADENALAASHRDGSGKGDILRMRNNQHLLVRRSYLNCSWRRGNEAQVIAALYINNGLGAVA